MMRRAAWALAAGLLWSSPCLAGDPIGLDNEQSLALKGTVVDLVCELTGRCVANCGGGKRQLGLKAEDGRLYATIKSAVDFAGANVDLLPHCGRLIEVDGLLIDSPRMKLYLAQKIRPAPTDPWTPTTAFLGDWRAHNPAAGGKPEEWYRSDPEVRAIIDADGVLGVRGLEPKKQ